MTQRECRNPLICRDDAEAEGEELGGEVEKGDKQEDAESVVFHCSANT